MAHSHGHSHSHSDKLKDTPIRILSICIALNLLFIVVEAFAGWRSNSTGLLSDAGHNLGDALGLLLSLLAIIMTRSDSVKSKNISKFVTLINGLLLLGAVVIVVIESLERLMYPQEVHSQMVIIVSTAAIVVNGLTAWLLMRQEKSNINIRAAYLHAATDMLVSVSVVISGVIISFTGWNIVDPILSLLVSVGIAIPAIKLLFSALRQIINH